VCREREREREMISVRRHKVTAVRVVATPYLPIDSDLSHSLVEEVLLLLAPLSIALRTIGRIEAIVVGVGVLVDELIGTDACFGPALHVGPCECIIEPELLERTTHHGRGGKWHSRQLGEIGERDSEHQEAVSGRFVTRSGGSVLLANLAHLALAR